MSGGYRAPNYGPTAEQQSLIQALRNGTTERQKRQAFMDKALVTGVSGALQVAGGTIAAQHDKDELEAKNRKIMSGAIADQTAMRDHAMPEWMRASDEAKMAQARQALNASAEGVRIGSYDTPQSAQNNAQNAASIGQDLQTGKALIGQGGGMSGSLATTGVAPDEDLTSYWGGR